MAGAADFKTQKQSLTITVSEVNDAPTRTAGSVSNVTVAEDSGTTSLGLGSVSYSTGPANESGQGLTYTVTAVPAGTLGDVVLADGSKGVSSDSTYTLAQIRGMQFKEAADANGGPASFSYTVSDDGTTAGANDFKTLTQSLTSTVSKVNDEPTRTAGSVSNVTVAEDSGTTSLCFESVSYSRGLHYFPTRRSSDLVTAVPAGTLGDVVLA